MFIDELKATVCLMHFSLFQNKIVTGQDQHEVTKKSKKKRKSIVSVVKTNKKSKKIAN